MLQRSWKSFTSRSGWNGCGRIMAMLLFFLVTTTANGDPQPPAKPFPQRGLLPKQEIGALSLLKKYPERDGRGVIVAVFDTGVDPGAAGLLTTSDGKPKILDIVDGTGSGDVLMERIPKPQGQTIIGATGRTLKLNPAWKNPTGEYHIGWKPASDLFPGRLAARLKRERKRDFDIVRRKIEVRLRRKIEIWTAAHPSPSLQQRQEKQELQTRLERLQAEANAADPGAVFDCVVFHDGKHWRAVIDTDEDGDLADETALTNYRRERKYATFGNGAELNFSVNIYENGKRLSIVCGAGAHGTHVAGIIAAHYPDQPELNGIAPGAQIVSVKIGDTHLGGMETGVGLVRGLYAVIDNKCDLINMSYGEATSVPNRGRLISLLSDVVRKHGVIFVASAGNEGPALSTVGSPGGTSSQIIGVGAYVSPKMMAVEYTLRKKIPGLPYTWTSRGPTFDGDLGVNIFAPGGAIAPVPAWTLQKSMRMNGTSMASPNCCGGLALILSVLKAENIVYSPSSIRRAIANTARRIDSSDVFAQGPGLLQVDRALAYLQKYEKCVGEQLDFDLQVTRGKTTRGIYLRSERESSQPTVGTVSVKPVFPENAKPGEKTEFEMRFSLHATAEWVETGKYTLMTHGGVQFSVRVDPMKLAPGAHFAEVYGFDANNPGRGPIFRLPVTVLKPTSLTSSNENGCEYQETGLTFAAGRLQRRFFVVPEGAEWADLSLLLTTPGEQSRRFVVHTLKALPGQSIDDVASRKFVTLHHGREFVQSFSVHSGRMVELCLAQYWSSLGKSTLSIKLNFRGLRPNSRTLVLSPGTPTARVEVTALTGRERLSPTALLKTHRVFHRPVSSSLRFLSSVRDRLADGRTLFELLLTYEFEQTSAGAVTPRFPQIDGMLYDSPFGGHLWMLFDSKRRLVRTDDVWPSAVSLPKGRYTLKLRLRHSELSRLRKTRSLLLALDRPLSPAIPLSIYSSRVAAVEGKAKFASRLLRRGEKGVMILAAPQLSQLPKRAVDGDMLLGRVHYGRTKSVSAGSGQRPGGYPLRYAVTGTGRSRIAKQKRASSLPSGGSLEARQRELKFAELESLAERGKPSAAFERLASGLLKESPGDLRVFKMKLKLLDHVKYRKKRLSAIVAAADAILKRIDTKALAQEFGTRVNPDDAAAVRKRKTMEAEKETLIDTLYRKGRALGYMELPDVLAKHPIPDPKSHDRNFAATFAKLRRWVKTTDRKYVLLGVRRERRKKRYGKALKLLENYKSDSASNYWYHKKRRDIFRKLGWHHLAKLEVRQLAIRYPKRFTPF